MFILWFALPLAVQLIAAADGVPKLDVTPSCRGAAKSGYISSAEDRLKSCIESELRTRDQLDKQWAEFPVADRTDCFAAIKGFQPTYSELATCLEMKRDLRKLRSDGPAGAASPTPARTR
ncbi:MAG: hypothetical protein WCG92_26630 [Hyphomicrobiales bacterium]